MDSTLTQAKQHLFDLKVNLKSFENDKKKTLQTISDKTNELGFFKERLTHLHIAERIIQEVVEKVSKQNLLKIEGFVNRALACVFTDLNLSFKINQEVKRGNNTYSFEIFNDDIPGSIHSFGGGVVAVIAVVLKILFNIITKRFPLLVLDETLSFLATHYIPAMSEFLRTLSKEFDLPIILVAHQPEFAIAADQCYNVSLLNGNTQVKLT